MDISPRDYNAHNIFRNIAVSACIFLFPVLLSAQSPPTPADTSKHRDSTEMQMSGMNMDDMDMQMEMPSKSNDSPMSMKGSGTSWLPESSPMHMLMQNSGNWMFMEHGGAFVRYDHQGGVRGGEKLDAPNWFMGMAERDFDSTSHLRFSGMFSLDPLTEGGDGYPLLFQTGETWHNIPLIDRQHPHNLFAELSAYYSRTIIGDASAFAYIGYPGEPALGPPAFMHRPSAMYLPDAPITHHWQDATHITFGVATAGIVYDRLKIEGSAFNGTEPDENKYSFDTLRINSFSGRISYNPTRDIALQISNGFLRNPENNGIDVHRTTASVLYAAQIGGSGGSNWNSSLVWGQDYDDQSGVQNSALLESAYTFSEYAVSARFEIVQKPQFELGIFADPTAKETVGEYTLGLSRNIFSVGEVNVMLGAQGTIYTMPESLVQYYGSNPFSFEIYLGIHPAEMMGMAGGNMDMDMPEMR